MSDKIIDLMKRLKQMKSSSEKTPADLAFDDLREEINKLLGQYADKMTNMSIVNKLNTLLPELEGVQFSDASGYTYDRATTNIAVVSSRIRRTHYAAYMAGKWSVSDEIGDKFKCWMHNASANGAISLAELIDDILIKEKENKGRNHFQLLKVFRNGSYEDASRFLSLSKEFDPNSVLTKYNEAKLDIISKSVSRREHGIEMLKEISTPTKNDPHPAEWSWHQNNFEMYSKYDKQMRKIIKVHDSDSEIIIMDRLKNNNEEAVKHIHPGMWDNQHEPNKALMVTFLLSVALSGIAITNPEYIEFIKEFISITTDLLVSNVPEIAGETYASLGDGGLAKQLVVSSSDVLRATFGDGGLA